MKRIHLWLLLALGLLFAVPVAAPVTAQDGDICPASVLLALARAGAACQRAERDRACYGSGAVAATFQPGVSDVLFEMPGDIVDVAALRSVRVGAPGDEEADWSVAVLHLQANLIGTEQRSVALLLFGDAEIENRVPPAPEVTATATGTLNIRAAPEADADILAQLNVRETLTANGRTDEGNWLRVLIPNTNDLGWIAREVVTVEGDVAALGVVEATTPFYRPFQVFTLRTEADDARCDGAPESGLLIQTPNTFTDVDLIVNGMAVRLAATAYLQTVGDALVLNVLDGGAEIEAFEEIRFVPAGARVRVPLGDDLLAAEAPAPTEPYDAADLAALPVNNLPYRLRVPPPLTAAELETILAEHFAPEPTPAPTETPESAPRCERVARRNTDLRAGPGSFYEVVNPLARGTRVTPVFQVTDADGMVWWQLRGGNWVRAADIEETGECSPVPVTDVIQPPPDNSLSLETCITGSGPLRAGQRVTLEFIPPGWDTLAEAQEAVRVDPGRITVDGQRLQVQASDPIRIAEDRYIRTFSAAWAATAGAHRIVGERLSYIASCNVTVPVGP